MSDEQAKQINGMIKTITKGGLGSLTMVILGVVIWATRLEGGLKEALALSKENKVAISEQLPKELVTSELKHLKESVEDVKKSVGKIEKQNERLYIRLDRVLEIISKGSKG